MQLTPATGGDPTISASTVEGAFYQMIEFLQMAESNTDINGSGVNRTTGSINTDALTYRGAFDFSANPVVSDDGTFSLATTDYLTIPTWSPGDGTGTLKSQTWSGQLLELLKLWVESQNDTVKNPSQLIWVEPTYSLVDRKVTGNFYDIPLERVQTTDGWNYKAKEVF